MCFSQFAQYAPRPVYEYEPPERPEGTPPTVADQDPELYGPIPLPPEWQKPAMHDNGHQHNGHAVQNGQPSNGTVHATTPAATVYAANGQTNGQAAGGNAIASVSTQTVEAVVVELSNGTRLLICPL